MATRKKRGVDICIVPLCPNEPHSRGACQSCLAVARSKINSGEITDAELVAAGLLLPSKKRGMKSGSAMAKALAKRK